MRLGATTAGVAVRERSHPSLRPPWGRSRGSSDCREGCPAHLIRLPDDFELGRLPHLLRETE
ncbi:MAG: hypothetical protein FJ011_14725 [Chloroflexi bacterium]|nr:hypothetical protein [Chloroflexota bacterium]